MGLVGVVYKTSKFAYKAYKNYRRVKKIVKTGEVIYKGSKDMYNKVKSINDPTYEYNNGTSSNVNEIKNERLQVNNTIQYPVSESKPLINKDTISKGIDIVTWLI